MSISEFHAETVYAGYREADANSTYARFLKPEDPGWAEAITQACALPLPTEEITPFTEIAATLSRPGYLPHETGWGALANGTGFVSAHTPMPGVRPDMWDWWFSWHGSESARYKLWAPSEHFVAHWRDGDGERPGLKSYIGRTSLIKENIGSTFLQGAIRFVDPAVVGFVPGAFDGTVICGRAGEVDAPVEHTWLVHQVRATQDGCEMRSRFYLGQDPQFTHTGEPLPKPPPGAPRPGPVPLELMRHCLTEMHHLAGFLPVLHAEFAA
ncbi:MAG: hypothetical protein POH28_02220 [Acidocella sp.]|nr:hypothetical protein [Acidocella sp.]